MSIYSLSLSVQLTLDMHSLNNEGGEGNQIQTRMVNIVDGEGKLQNVNAISGDMIKHILAEHLHRIATANGLPLCVGCRTLNANRISADEGYLSDIANDSDILALSKLIQRCAMDDMLGNLVTTKGTKEIKGRSLPRKSVVEFGWVVGVPGKVKSDSFFHVKYAGERDTKTISEQSSEEARGQNLGQIPFHRPANSGVYALIATIEAARIGLNDITHEYVISEEERQARFNALLEALLYTLVEPSGAMRGTQAPHIVDVTGVVTVSRNVIPAPTLSPLKEGYDAQLAALCETLNGIRPDALSAHRFSSLTEYAQQMSALMQDQPFTMHYTG
jgi:CRISPR-associated protein Cst2